MKSRKIDLFQFSTKKELLLYLGILLSLQHLFSCFIYATFHYKSATQTCHFHSRGHSCWQLEWNKSVQDHSSVSNKQMYAVSNIQIDSMSIISTMQPNKYQRIEKNSEYLLGPAQERLILQSKDCLQPR